jgi:hypothetical protein
LDSNQRNKAGVIETGGIVNKLRYFCLIHSPTGNYTLLTEVPILVFATELAFGIQQKWASAYNSESRGISISQQAID